MKRLTVGGETKTAPNQGPRSKLRIRTVLTLCEQAARQAARLFRRANAKLCLQTHFKLPHIGRNSMLFAAFTKTAQDTLVGFFTQRVECQHSPESFER